MVQATVATACLARRMAAAVVLWVVLAYEFMRIASDCQTPESRRAERYAQTKQKQPRIEHCGGPEPSAVLYKPVSRGQERLKAFFLPCKTQAYLRPAAPKGAWRLRDAEIRSGRSQLRPRQPDLTGILVSTSRMCLALGSGSSTRTTIRSLRTFSWSTIHVSSALRPSLM